MAHQFKTLEFISTLIVLGTLESIAVQVEQIAILGPLSPTNTLFIVCITTEEALKFLAEEDSIKAILSIVHSKKCIIILMNCKD